VIPELRKEIRDTLAASDGVMTTKALFRMKLLDSVMRESQRVNPSTPARFERVVMRNIKLSDGTEIPTGTWIGAAHVETLRNPDYYPDPLTYDPHRFADLRSGATADPLGYANTEQYQFISVSKQNLGWGYGRHACPGRFFASNEIKMILVRILLEYDIKLPDGVEGRYPNIVRGMFISVDPTKDILFRKIAKHDEKMFSAMN
jgi:cytochrome P450